MDKDFDVFKNENGLHRMVINEVMADRYLTVNWFDGQRDVSQKWVDFIASQMEGSKFSTSTTIKFGGLDSKTYLLDGQHRLRAILQTKKPYPFVVVKDLYDSLEEMRDEYSVIDGNRKRTRVDSLISHKYHEKLGVSKQYAKKVLVGMELLIDNFNSTSREPKNPNDVVKELDNWIDEVHIYHDLTNNISSIFSNPKYWRSTVSVALYLLKYQTKKAVSFFTEVYSDDQLKRFSPEKGMADFFKTAKVHGFKHLIGGYSVDMLLDRMAYYWNSFYEGKDVKRNLPKDYKFHLLGTPLSGKEKK